MAKKSDDLRRAYKRADLGKPERGKFVKPAAKGTIVVLLDSDVAKAFPTSESVNETLRGLMDLSKKSRIGRPRSRRRIEIAR